MKLAAIIALLCIALYFAVLLPLNDRAKLQLEREKFEQQEKVRQEKGQAELDKQQEIKDAKNQAQTDLLNCRVAAENSYNSSLELNGKAVPGKKDVFTGPQSMFNELKKRQREEDAECQKQYELDLKAAEEK